jgi:hypothetical protein
MNLLWQSVCAIAFGAACWAVGDFIRKRLIDAKFALPALARHTLAFTTGNVTLSYILTALGFARFFIAPVLWAVFLIGIGLAVWRIALEFRKPPAPSSSLFGHGAEGRDICIHFFNCHSRSISLISDPPGSGSTLRP